MSEESKNRRSTRTGASQRRGVLRSKALVYATLTVAIASTAVSCGKKPNDNELATQAQLDVINKTPLVLTATLQSGASQSSSRFAGVAKENRTVKSSFRVAGPIIELPAEIGKRVAKGDALAKIDPRDYLLAVRQVEEGLREANAALAAMKTGARAEDVASLQAAVDAAQSRYDVALLNEQRFARLLANNSAPQAKYDEVKLLLDQASAGLESARQNLTKATAGARQEDVEAMEAKIAGLQTTLEKAQNALNDATIYAPSDGYVSQKYVETGEIVSPGTPVLAFTESAQIRVQTYIPESILVKREQIERFTCEFEAYPNRTFEAQLHELGLARQAGKQGYPLEVEVACDEDCEILPGMTANVTVWFKGDTESFLAPLSALVGNDLDDANTQDAEEMNHTGRVEQTFVWRVDPQTQKLQRVRVSIVRLTPNGAIIQAPQLAEADRVVVAGARFLHDGEDVRIK